MVKQDHSQGVKAHLNVMVLGAFCAFALCLLPVIGLFVFGLESATCSFVQGSCKYDPRTERPSRQFIRVAPEQHVVQYIKDQMRQFGTFPPGAGSGVATITPVLVTARGFNTDWHVVANVLVEITYSDGRIQEELFELLSYTNTQLLGIETIMMEAEFGPIKQCDQSPTGRWDCHQ